MDVIESHFLAPRHTIIVCRADIFITFKLLSPKTPEVLIINVKIISRLGVRPGKATCVNATRVNH
jgi:hypothetical protein